MKKKKVFKGWMAGNIDPCWEGYGESKTLSRTATAGNTNAKIFIDSIEWEEEE